MIWDHNFLNHDLKIFVDGYYSPLPEHACNFLDFQITIWKDYQVKHYEHLKSGYRYKS